MAAAFLAGVAAGYAIAVPVGVIAILLLETGMRRGLRVALAGAAGVASADTLYAAIAVIFGTAVAEVIAPLARPIRIVAVVVLVIIGVRGLLALRGGSGAGPSEGLPTTPLGTYARLLALTLLNPATVVYFAALILALPAVGQAPSERVAFVVGVLLASLSWQSLLAATGALGHRRLSPRVQVAASVAGYVVVLAFAGGDRRGSHLRLSIRAGAGVALRDDERAHRQRGRRNAMTNRTDGSRGFRGPELVGIVLIVIGVVYFLGNTNIIQVSWSLIWPVLIVGVGVLIVLSAMRPRGDRTGSADIPRDGVQQLELALSLGAGAFALSGGATQLVEVRSNDDDIVAQVDRNGPRTRVRLRQDTAWFPFGGHGTSWQIRAAGDVATALTLSGGAGTFSLDLSAMRIVDVQVSMGAASLDIILPRPAGEVRVRVSGGAASVNVRVPDGVEARVMTSGGLISVQGRGETPGYSTARDRVSVTVSGGATSVRVV